MTSSSSPNRDTQQSISPILTGSIPEHDRLAAVHVMHEGENIQDEINMAHNDTPSELAVDLAVGATQTSIPLQTLSPAGTSSPSNDASPIQVAANQNQAEQGSNKALPFSKRLSIWIWHKGCVIWSWIMSVVMMVLTAVTYLVTKFQNSASSLGNAQERYRQESQKWRNMKDYYDYCQQQKDAARKYGDDCRKALQDGVAPPPQPPLDRRSAWNAPYPQRTGSSRPSYISEIFTKAKRMVQDIEREIERHISTAVDILNSDINNPPNPYVGGGAVRRRW